LILVFKGLILQAHNSFASSYTAPNDMKT